MKENQLLVKLRDGCELSFKDQILLIVRLSIPAIMANISQLLMEYIDSSMVGRLGKEGSAAIGIVAPTTWLGGGLLIAASYGFSVQVAQYIGAKNEKRARDLVHEGLVVGLVWSLLGRFTRDFTSPALLGHPSNTQPHQYAYTTLTHSGHPSQGVQLPTRSHAPLRQKEENRQAPQHRTRNPRRVSHAHGLAILRFRSPLLTEYLLLRVLRCFTSPRHPPHPIQFRCR